MGLNSKKDVRILQLHQRQSALIVKMELVKNLPMNVKPAYKKEKLNFSLDQNANGLLKYAKKTNNASTVHASAYSTKKISRT